MASDYLENKINDHILGKAEYSMPQAFIALCTASITDAMTGATIPEFSDAGNYGRVTTTNTDWGSSVDGTSTNAVQQLFGVASAELGTAVSFALLDSATHGEGNVLASGLLAIPTLYEANDRPNFDIGELQVITI